MFNLVLGAVNLLDKKFHEMATKVGEHMTKIDGHMTDYSKEYHQDSMKLLEKINSFSPSSSNSSFLEKGKEKIDLNSVKEENQEKESKFSFKKITFEEKLTKFPPREKVDKFKIIYQRLASGFHVPRKS